jgi:hypothetical protein
MALRSTEPCRFAVLVLWIFCGVGCASNIVIDAPDPTFTTQPLTVEHTVDAESTADAAASEFGTTPTPSYLILAVNRQVPPSEIQFQVRWFDVGAGYARPALPVGAPRIQVFGADVPGQTMTVHYSGFEPGEVITTVWYVGAYYLFSDYLTSWQTVADASGAASESIFIPKDFCVNHDLLVAALGENPQQKSWDLGGWDIDLLASAVEQLHLTLDCEEESLEFPEQVIDSSSRFLRQLDMGVIRDGEIQLGALTSTMEAHNWVYEAAAGTRFLVQVKFLQNSFPVDRIGILDPGGNMVYECADTVRGCGLGGVSEIEYLPDVSGAYIIRIDMFSQEDGAYSVLVKSTSDGGSPAPDEIVIDDLDPGLLLQGPDDGWRTAPYGYKGSTHWTYCTDESASNWAKWIPQLPVRGNYRVLVFVPEHKAGTAQAKYHIFHNDIDSKEVVRQADYANVWVELGAFWFAADGTEYVYLDDDTGEPRSSDITMAFDAVKFVYVP